MSAETDALPAADVVTEPMPLPVADTVALELADAAPGARAWTAALVVALPLDEAWTRAVASMSPPTLDVPELLAVRSPSP
jgi:hypothetical protein